MSAEDAVRKFQREMRKLGLGVSIKAGDGDWIVVTEPPEPASTDSDGDQAVAPKKKSRAPRVVSDTSEEGK